MRPTIAPAGAGMPTKKLSRQAGWSGSSSITLKRASLSAQAMAKRSVTTQPKLLTAWRSATNRTIAGATPKSTKSASESSSAPNRDVPLSARAIRPSRPSRTAAPAMALTAQSIEPSMARRMAVRPRQSASSVTMLGRRSRSGTGRNPRRGAGAALGSRVSGAGPESFIGRSAPLERARRGPLRDLSDHGFAGDRPRLEADHDLGVCGQIDVDPRAEPDQADPLARAQMRAFVGEAHDSPGDQARDLHHPVPARRRLDDEAVALVVLARLVEVGVEKEAWMVDDPLDSPRDRRAVHMAVEHRHENRDALQRPHAQSQLGGRAGEAGEADHAVGRRDHEIGADRRHARGIAEEIGAPKRGDQPQPAERIPQPPENQGDDREACDEEVALRMDRRESAAEGVDDAHGWELDGMRRALMAPNGANVTARPANRQRRGGGPGDRDFPARSRPARPPRPVRRPLFAASPPQRRPRAGGSRARRKRLEAPAAPRASRARRSFPCPKRGSRPRRRLWTDDGR